MSGLFVIACSSYVQYWFLEKAMLRGLTFPGYFHLHFKTYKDNIL